jgi:hypothetical protein
VSAVEPLQATAMCPSLAAIHGLSQRSSGRSEF